MPIRAWSRKRERQYEHIKEGLEQHGRDEDTAQQIAARTVNKERARAGEAKQSSRTSTQDGQPSRARHLAQLAVVAGSYYLAARLSLRISLVGGVVTPIWPPTGIAVVALLGYGSRVWPAITAAALLVNLPINDSVGTALL